MKKFFHDIMPGVEKKGEVRNRFVEWFDGAWPKEDIDGVEKIKSEAEINSVLAILLTTQKDRYETRELYKYFAITFMNMLEAKETKLTKQDEKAEKEYLEVNRPEDYELNDREFRDNFVDKPNEREGYDNDRYGISSLFSMVNDSDHFYLKSSEEFAGVKKALAQLDKMRKGLQKGEELTMEKLEQMSELAETAQILADKYIAKKDKAYDVDYTMREEVLEDRLRDGGASDSSVQRYMAILNVKKRINGYIQNIKTATEKHMVKEQRKQEKTLNQGTVGYYKEYIKDSLESAVENAKSELVIGQKTLKSETDKIYGKGKLSYQAVIMYGKMLDDKRWGLEYLKKDMAARTANKDNDQKLSQLSGIPNKLAFTKLLSANLINIILDKNPNIFDGRRDQTEFLRNIDNYVDTRFGNGFDMKKMSAKDELKFLAPGPDFEKLTAECAMSIGLGKELGLEELLEDKVEKKTEEKTEERIEEKTLEGNSNAL